MHIDASLCPSDADQPLNPSQESCLSASDGSLPPDSLSHASHTSRLSSERLVVGFPSGCAVVALNELSSSPVRLSTCSAPFTATGEVHFYLDDEHRRLSISEKAAEPDTIIVLIPSGRTIEL